MTCLNSSDAVQCEARRFRPASADAISRVAAGRLSRGLRLVLRWMERSRQRHDLGELETYRLADIGVSPSEAWTEAQKPFWRP